MSSHTHASSTAFPAPLDLQTASGRRARTWLIERFPVYSRVCLTAGIFLAPVALNVGALEPFMLVKITLVWFFGVCALGLWLMSSAEQRAWLPPMRVTRALGIFIAACVLATIASTNRTVSFIGLFGRYGGLIPLLLYAAIAICMVGLYWKRTEKLGEIPWACVVGSAILAGYVLIEAAGLDWAHWTDNSTGQAPDYPPGTMGNSNFAGSYLAIALPFVLYAALTATNKSIKRAMAVLLGLEVLALWCTQTRGGMVGAAAGMATLVLLSRHHAPLWAMRAVVSGLALVVFVGALAIWHPGLDEAPGPLNRLHAFNANTIGYRVYYWTAAGRIIRHHPLVGTGPDTFGEYYPRYRLQEDGAKLGTSVADKPHNIFLEYGANTGLLGLLSYLAMVSLVLRYGFLRARRVEGHQHLLLVSFLATLMAYLVQGFFSIDVPPLALMGWVAIGGVVALADPGIVAARDAMKRSPEGGAVTEPATRLPATRWPVHALLVASAVALVVLGTRPLRADVRGRGGNLADAIRMFPIEPAYRAQAGHAARNLAQAARTPPEQRHWLEKAEIRFTEAHRLQPKSVEYILQLARTEVLWARTLDPTRFTEAERWWRRALAGDPTDLMLRRLYEADVAAQRGMASQLEADLSVRPNEAHAWIRLAQVSLGLNEPKKAERALGAALRIDPANEEAKRLLLRASRMAVGLRVAG